MSQQPATFEEIEASLPTQAKVLDPDRWRDITRVRSIYGPYARILSRTIVEKFMGQKMYCIDGRRGWDNFKDPSPTKEQRMHFMDPLVPLSIEEDDPYPRLWSIMHDEKQDNMYVYYDDVVTGCDGDPVFVFLKPVTTTTKVTGGASKRKPKRKAPAGHARDWAGQVAKGADKKMWVSKKLDGKDIYRWIRVD